ncbi:hypothetical protein IAU60_006017 [Kwoniella sp. DSM 27419]
MAPSISPSTTHYALVIDAGSSGSRLQIYSWRDPDLERAEIMQEVRAARSGGEEAVKSRWWWDSLDRLGAKVKGSKGKGKEREDVMETSALRRLVRVGKGVEGDDWVKRAEPGISTVDPQDIPTYLAPLLSHALRHIPPSQHSSTPIYVLATAGMRLLPEHNRKAILAATCDLIKKDYPFEVDGPSSAGPCGDSIRVISGEEEGMWGWVAVNYLMDGFGHAPESTHHQLQTVTPSHAGAHDSSPSNLLPLAPLADPPPHSSTDSVTPVDVNHHSPTFGFLDMGGASTQLAFSPSTNEIIKSGYPKEQLGSVSLRLLSGEVVEWPVFVASWLGFGTNRARERYADGLITKWQKQYEATGTSLDKPIVDPCLPANLEIPSTNPAKYPGFVGSGSFSECLTQLTPLLEHSTPCPTEHCLFAGLPTPHIDFQREDQRGFIGISEYWYTSEQVLGLGGVWDWGEWEKGMNEFCSKDWKDIEAQVEKEKGWRGSAIGPHRLQLQCFKGAWISNVLHEGIGIPRLVDAGGNGTLTGGEIGDTNAEAEHRAREKGLLGHKPKHHFQSMDEVGATAISWTLGKMVIEASKAVRPRSVAAESAWSAKLGNLPLGGWEERLEKMGIQTIWAYGFVTFFVLACVFTTLRRRWRGKPGTKRNRKSSAASYSIEEGFSSDSSTMSSSGGSKARFATPGRIRLWTLRMTQATNRYIPVGLHLGRHAPLTRPSGLPRHNSMPLPMLSGGPYTPTNSQPPSPRGLAGSFFTPAYAQTSTASGNLTVPTTRPSSTSPELGLGGLGKGTAYSSSSIRSLAASGSSSPVPTGSPPRVKSTRGKMRNASYPYLAAAGAASGSGANTSGGWNDPPTSMLSHSHGHSLTQNPYDQVDSRSGGLGMSMSGTLTPTAANLSRNSSRVNLVDMGGMAMRASRAGTPGYDDTP